MKNTFTAPCILLLIAATVRPFPVYGLVNYLPGARSLGLSHASVSFSDTWSAFHNQAGMAELSAVSSGFYFESRFGIPELAMVAGSVILPTAMGAFGLSFLQFGKGSYEENKLGLGYALKLSKKWNAGIQLDYFYLALPENQRIRGFATFEGGILFNPNEKLSLGMHLFNPVSEGIQTLSGKMRMPFTFRGGGHYYFDKSVLISFEVQEEFQNPARVIAGIEFSPADNLALRFGVAGNPFNYTAGTGYRAGRFSADIAFSCHSHLGITPSVSVQFNSF